jgi:integrase
MPRKYQNPKLEVRRDVDRPYYFIRVSVPMITSAGTTTRTRERKILGFLDEISRRDAMHRRAEILEAVNAGRVILASQVRMRDLIVRYKEARLPMLGAGTAARYTSQIDRHVLPAFGERKLCDVDRAAIETWLAGKERDGLSWWFREGLRSVVSAIFTAAKDWQLWAADNPATGVRIGRKRLVREQKLLDADQIRTILAAVSDRTRFMILVALAIGLRISEVCGLQWRDIDLRAGTLTVRRRWYRGDLDEPKSEASKRVRELGPLAVEFRRRYPGPQARDRFVFIGDDGVTPPDERDILRYELRPILRRLGLYYPGFGWHAFRRQNVTWRQTKGGATPLEAQRAAGHGSVDVTMLYTITDAERDRAQVQAIMDELVGKPTSEVQ